MFAPTSNDEQQLKWPPRSWHSLRLQSEHSNKTRCIRMSRNKCFPVVLLGALSVVSRINDKLASLSELTVAAGSGFLLICTHWKRRRKNSRRPAARRSDGRRGGPSRRLAAAGAASPVLGGYITIHRRRRVPRTGQIHN